VAAKETPKPPAADRKDAIPYRGRILGPDGRPFAGAKVYVALAYSVSGPSPSPTHATTGPDGRFAFTVPKAKFGDRWIDVVATAPKHGPGWVSIPQGGKSDNLTLRLVEDAPITGEILDLEGKPVPGATLTVVTVRAAPKEDLGPWLEVVKAKKGLSLELQGQYLKRSTRALSLKVTTDDRGRFRLTGIGRNRLVTAQLDGPTVVSQRLYILTRPGKPIEVTADKGKPEYGEPRRVTTYYGASFRHVAAPTKPIAGVVRDKDSRKPLAGITIRSFTMAPEPHRGVDIVQTTTDARGRYRLTGMPKGEGNRILAIPGKDQPYVALQAKVPDTPGLDSVTVDFEMRRGVWIEGKLTDKVTGKPVRGSVEYFSLFSNPSLRDYPGFDGAIVRVYNMTGTKEDGSYRVVGLPGPGLVAVWAPNHYLPAPHRDDEYGVKESSLLTSPYHMTITSGYQALARVNPAKGAEKAKRDVTLDPGWTFTGTVLGPDGKPLAAAWRLGVTRESEKTKTAEFTVETFNPGRPRDILFVHLEKGLVGVAPLPKKNGDSVTVRLEPGAVATGRLVDADGKPRPGVALEVRMQPRGSGFWYPYPPERIKTDREGRFRLEALVPGCKFHLSDDKGHLSFGDGLRLGRTKDLGDVRIKGENE
jgi:protocatechuate 3,4-dioxygenase beta subunit